MVLAIIGGAPAQVVPLVDLYRQAGAEAGHNPESLKIGVASHFHIAKTSQQAREEFYPYYAHYLRPSSPGARGWHVSPADYEQLASPRGGLFVGSPQEIVEKLLYEYELFGHQRFLAQLDIGGMPYAMVAEAIELFATEVAPVIRRETTPGS
jgi:alkanesulfonate monooxygenase SsuD/methylene tetrahydromethanopterin reductase-like flavin-dependent oxidoreductase (luciferase family)